MKPCTYNPGNGEFIFTFKKTLEEKFTHLMAGKLVDFFTIFLQMFFF